MTTNSLEKIVARAKKRVINALNNYKNDANYKKDYLCALRNYLLLTKNSLSGEIDYSQEELDEFGLYVNEEEKLTAKLAIPDFIPEEDYPFIHSAFLEDTEERPAKEKYCLSVDPAIFRLTGGKIQTFKSISQKLAVNGALMTPEGYTTLISMPTGGGKSLITQTVAYQKKGLTIVVVPTVSLAIDQERVAKNIICTADSETEIVSYSSSTENKEEIINNIKNKKVKLLFISPEALIENQILSKCIADLNKEQFVRNIVIDEAHIVIEWGGLFRVDYQCLETWRKKLLIDNNNIRTFLLSATYTDDTITQLKSLFSSDDKWIEIRCDELRHEPRFICVKTKSHKKKIDYAVELVKKMPHPIIIYESSPKSAEDFKKRLLEEGFHNVKTFTGNTRAENRKSLIDEWTDDKFEIMVATSAFGIGVDKPDVRTVLNMYIPETPNAYYQQLGRGGRDGFPCLSIMCIDTTEDFNYSKVTKTMTVEKIVGRWLSMLNDESQYRDNNGYFLNTNVKPLYNINSYRDEAKSSGDVNWNVYVLLLLRRYNLIKFVDMRKDGDQYCFGVKILDDRLLSNSNDDPMLNSLIEDIRDKEVKRAESAYNNICDSIKYCGESCWSEMFYSTYSEVSEYCAGCDSHSEVRNEEPYRFCLKKSIRKPLKPILNESKALMENLNEAFIKYDDDNLIRLLDYLIKHGFTTIVIADIDTWDKLDFISKSTADNHFDIMDCYEFEQLIRHRGFYYLSGSIAAVYYDNEDLSYRLLKKISNMKSQMNISEYSVLHVVPSDMEIKKISKRFSDFLPRIEIDQF